MLIVYDSRTGNVERFVRKLGLDVLKLHDSESQQVEEPFVMVTYTTGFGHVPAQVMNFLNRNRAHLRGVSASGNRNWGATFAGSADAIAEQFGVPIVHKFELSGTSTDVQRFREGLNRVAAH